MSMCGVVSCIVGCGCLLQPVPSLDKILVTLCPALFRIPRPNLPVTPNVSWLPTFAFQSPMMKRTSLLVLVLKGLIGLCGTHQLHLLQHQWLGHRLWWLWCWIVCLGNEIILSFLRLPPSTTFWTLLLTLRATPFLLRESCPSSRYNVHLN